MKKQFLLFTLILISGWYSCSDPSESKMFSISELESLVTDPNAEENLIQNGFEKLPDYQGNSFMTTTFAKGKKETKEGKTYWTQMVDRPKGRPGIGYSVIDEKFFLDFKKQISATTEDMGKKQRIHIFKKDDGTNFAFQIDSTKKDIPTYYRILIEQKRKQ